LADADLGRKVDDSIDAVQRPVDRGAIPNIADEQLHVAVEVVRTRGSLVDLRHQAVQRANLAACSEQFIREM
jgi:hypothetical protein